VEGVTGKQWTREAEQKWQFGNEKKYVPLETYKGGGHKIGGVNMKIWGVFGYAVRG